MSSGVGPQALGNKISIGCFVDRSTGPVVGGILSNASYTVTSQYAVFESPIPVSEGPSSTPSSCPVCGATFTITLDRFSGVVCGIPDLPEEYGKLMTDARRAYVRRADDALYGSIAILLATWALFCISLWQDWGWFDLPGTSGYFMVLAFALIVAVIPMFVFHEWYESHIPRNDYKKVWDIVSSNDYWEFTIFTGQIPDGFPERSLWVKRASLTDQSWGAHVFYEGIVSTELSWEEGLGEAQGAFPYAARKRFE